MAHSIKIGDIEIGNAEDGISIGNDELPDTLLGYPIVYCDDMSTETVGIISFGPPLFDEAPRPTRITVSDGNGNVWTGAIEWKDNGDRWVGIIVWDEKEPDEVK